MEKLCRGEGTSADPEGSCEYSDGQRWTATDCSLQEGTPRQGPSILFKEPLSHFSPSFAKNSSGGDAGQDISEFFCC